MNIRKLMKSKRVRYSLEVLDGDTVLESRKLDMIVSELIDENERLRAKNQKLLQLLASAQAEIIE